jgi:hypothetical protein
MSTSCYFRPEIVPFLVKAYASASEIARVVIFSVEKEQVRIRYTDEYSSYVFEIYFPLNVVCVSGVINMVHSWHPVLEMLKSQTDYTHGLTVTYENGALIFDTVVAAVTVLAKETSLSVLSFPDKVMGFTVHSKELSSILVDLCVCGGVTEIQVTEETVTFSNFHISSAVEYKISKSRFFEIFCEKGQQCVIKCVTKFLKHASTTASNFSGHAVRAGVTAEGFMMKTVSKFGIVGTSFVARV